MTDPVAQFAGDGVFTVETLLKYMGDDASGRAIVVKIVRDAIAGGDQPLQQLAELFQTGRHADAARMLHGLRGSVGTLGAKRFVDAALAAELAIAENRLDELPALVAAVDSIFRLVLQQATAWLAAEDTLTSR